MDIVDTMPVSQRHVIIFDFDGTLADTKASILSTATTVLTRWGVPPESLERIGEIIGPPFPQAFEQVFGLSHEDAEEVTRRYREIYTHLGVEAWPAFPGVPHMLEALRSADRRLAVASSKRADLVERGLSDNGLMPFFEVVRAKEHDGEATKADAIRQIVAEMGASVSDAVMVGDRFHDVEAAAECGVPCVGVLYGDTADRAELEDAGAVAIAETVGELLGIILG